MSSTLLAETAGATPRTADKKAKKEKREKSEKKEKKHRRDSNDTERSSKKRKRIHGDGEDNEETQDTAVRVPQSETPSDEVLRKKRKKDKQRKIEKSTHNSSVHKPTATTIPQTDLNAENLLSHTPFYQRTTSLYLPLSPAAYAFPVAGLCAEHLSPLLLTYYPPLQGVILSYSNVRLSEDRPDNEEAFNPEANSEAFTQVLAKSINEYGPSFLWLTADFLVFRPARDTWMEGYINLQNESLIGLVCYNYFNAAIDRENLPDRWRWVEQGGDPDDDGGEEEITLASTGLEVGKQFKKRRRRAGDGVGWFVDAEGKKVEGKVSFRVVDFEATEGNSSDGGAGTVSILGTLRDDR